MLIWPSDENYGTNCDNLDMPIKGISEIPEVGVDDVNPVSVQKVTLSHRPMKNFVT